MSGSKPMGPFVVLDGPGELLVGWDGMAGYYTRDDLPDLIQKYGEDDWRVERLREKEEYFDEDEYQSNWDDEMGNLTEYMKEITPEGVPYGYWHIEGRNHGWLHRDGYLDTHAEIGEELVQKMLPNTENHFSIYYCTDANGLRGLAVNNAHHDVPMGGEMYYIFPAQDEEE